MLKFLSKYSNWSILLIILLLAYFMPLIPIGTESLRITAVFSSDETGIARILKYMINDKNLSTEGYFFYGSVYFYSTLILLLFFRLFLPISETLIVISFRIINLLSLIFIILILYNWGKKLFNEKIAFVSCLLFMTTPEVIRFTVTTHPDMLQVLFIVISLFFCCLIYQNYSEKNIVYASIFAGLAFGTKYAGLFILPIIFMASVIGIINDKQKRNRTYQKSLINKIYVRNLVLISVVFLLTFKVLPIVKTSFG